MRKRDDTEGHVTMGEVVNDREVVTCSIRVSLDDPSKEPSSTTASECDYREAPSALSIKIFYFDRHCSSMTCVLRGCPLREEGSPPADA